MARTSGEHIEKLIAQAKEFLTDVKIIRYELSQQRAIVDLEGNWKNYRIIVSEIYRLNKGIRYAYYILNKNQSIVHAFDNSLDNKAIRQKYGSEWKSHIHEEIPHQHDSENNLTLTPMMTFEDFIGWLLDGDF